MFSRAIKSHASSHPSTAGALSSSPPQQSSKNTTQLSLHSAFACKPASAAANKPDVLGPMQAMNGLQPHRHAVRPKFLHEIATAAASTSLSSSSRKQHHRQMTGNLAAVFDAGSAFQENQLPPAEAPASGFSAFHDAVYFDEADFDDDSDLDFELSVPILYPSLSKVAAKLSSPQPPQPPQRPIVNAYEDLEFPPRLPNAQPPSSSAPIPWSSSPVEHMQPRNAHPQPEAVQEIRPKPGGKRRLPWAVDLTVENLEVKAPKRTANAASRKAPGNAMPWNESFSSVEARKKEARKQNFAKQQKRTLTTTTGDPHETEQVRRGKEKIAKIFLSEEQRRVIGLVTNNKQSVFFTGSAGTGKSVLLRELIAALKKNHRKEGDAVAITASTGLAACNIGGVTLHSFAGIGLGKEPVSDLVKRVRKNQKAKTRWLRTKILIVDEVSMVDGDLFDKLEEIARKIRNNGKPFGGIQLVITGDFFQLPPVPEGGRAAKFAFDAQSWNSCIGHTIGLTQVFRQRDPEFANMLNEMRLGKLSTATIDTFRGLNRPIHYEDGIQATELFSTRREVENSNNLKMGQLHGEAIQFNAIDGGTVRDLTIRSKLLASCMAPAVIKLKVHSQVMLIKNMDDSLVNGSLGRVVGFMTENAFDMLDLRAKSDDTKHAPIDTGLAWPLVQFALMDGTSRQLLCQPEQWKIELPNGEVQASRLQVPLILAWALSIHKAQGQTLERVKVDLGKVFEKGQAYVALSRATCKEGLQVLRFEAKRVMAHDRVRQFYDGLYSASEAASRAKSSLKPLPLPPLPPLPPPTKFVHKEWPIPPPDKFAHDEEWFMEKEADLMAEQYKNIDKEQEIMDEEQFMREVARYNF